MIDWNGLRLAALAAALTLAPGLAPAQENVFAGGWTLQGGASSLRFQSVKNLTKVESSGFAEFSGAIAEDGTAQIRIALDSVDTNVDLRNVRMRFLFFETFQFPEAVVTAQLDPAQFADLRETRRKIIQLPYTLDLHGVTRASVAEVAVTLLSDDLVAVSTTAPISVAAEDHDLSGGITKLEEAASVTVVPSATVSFDFMFARAGPQGSGLTLASAQPAGAAAALETKGEFDDTACRGRFEILSRTDNIYFASGSARLDQRSAPLLDSLVDIIARCPGLVIEVAGHTDSDGSAAANQQLSERRAAAVADYLVGRDIPHDRIQTAGYGEARPAFSNDTADGKRRNRRIEFAVVN